MNLLLLTFAIFALQDEDKAKADPPTPKSVIDRYIERKGGRDRLSRIKNYVFKGEINIDGKPYAKIESYQAQGRHLTIHRFPDGSSTSHGTDGKTAWRIEADGTGKISEGNEAKQYIRHYSTLHQALEWSRQSKSIKYAGVVRIDGADLHKLTFKTQYDSEVYRYFSTKSGLFVREEETQGDEKSLLVSQILDYKRSKSGMLVSHRRVNLMESQSKVEFILDSVEANQINDDKVFAIPAVIRKLQSAKD